MAWLETDLAIWIISFLSSATGTALIVFFMRKIIRKALLLFGDKEQELGKVKSEAKDLISENKKLIAEVNGLIKNQSKLYEMCKTAFSNDPALVANGTAKRVVEIDAEEIKGER